MKFALGDTVKLKSLKIAVSTPQPNGTVTAIINKKITVTFPAAGNSTIKLVCPPEELELVAPVPEVMVVCYKCHKLVPQSKAYYIQGFDAYFDEKHYAELINGKSTKLPNYRRGDA